MLIFIHKKCELSFILGRSGIHSHVLQYQQKVHTRSVNIRYISEVHYNLWMIERLLNKANAIILMSFCFPSVSDARIPRSARKHLRGAGFAISPAKVLLFFHICKFFCIFEPFCYDSTKKSTAHAALFRCHKSVKTDYFFALSQMALKALGWFIARSARTLRLISIPAFFKAPINWL